MVDRIGPLLDRATRAVPSAHVQLAVLPPVTRLIMRSSAITTMAVPETCGTTTHGERTLLWLGPDEFLLLLPADAPHPAGAVDVSHRDAAISVSGPRAAWAINASCALDLHPSAFPVGRCTRTLFGKAGILLWRTHEQTFRIETARSLAPYVWDCLEEARREFLA
jgi:heterotetrameric sarcosine oxidase gamma subunit